MNPQVDTPTTPPSITPRLARLLLQIVQEDNERTREREPSDDRKAA